MENQGIFAEFIALFNNPLLLGVFDIFFGFAWIWLPFFLGFVAFTTWIRYTNKKFNLKFHWLLLEIRFPAEMTQSPRAMEIVLNGMHIGPSVGTWWDRLVDGKVLPWWSIEMISIGGDVHFYIRTREDFKDIVEANFYAQYPELQIFEVPPEDDPTRHVRMIPGVTKVWGCDYELNTSDAYPIKTYVDYGLDKENADVLDKPDPMASVAEYLSTAIGQGECIFLQLLFQQTKNRDRRKPGTWFKKEGWRDEAKRLIEKKRKEIQKLAGDIDEEVQIGRVNPTKVQSEHLAAMERKIMKQGYECGMRGYYWAELPYWGKVKSRGMNALMNHFTYNDLNGIHPVRYSVIVDWPWQDLFDIRENHYRTKVMEAFRKRSWFHAPFKNKPFVLNTEEMATIFHPIGHLSRAPGLNRITSRRSEAPSNLPT